MLKQKTINECIYAAIQSNNEILFKKYINKIEKPSFNILDVVMKYKNYGLLKHIEKNHDIFNKEIGYDDSYSLVKIPPLLYAFRKNDNVLAKYLINQGADINAKVKCYPGYISPLIIVLRENNIEGLELLLEANVDITMDKSNKQYQNIRKTYLDKAQPLIDMYCEKKQLESVIEKKVVEKSKMKI
jgi:ankyrin repeat protein